jgi:hypothetical protein
MTYQYYKRTLTTGELRALVRLQGNRVEHYDGKDIWNGNWVEAGQAYMDIIGMGGGWYLYKQVGIEEVEELKRELDAKYKERKLFAFAKRGNLARS